MLPTSARVGLYNSKNTQMKAHRAVGQYIWLTLEQSSKLFSQVIFYPCHTPAMTYLPYNTNIWAFQVFNKEALISSILKLRFCSVAFAECAWLSELPSEEGIQLYLPNFPSPIKIQQKTTPSQRIKSTKRQKWSVIFVGLISTLTNKTCGNPLQDKPQV